MGWLHAGCYSLWKLSWPDGRLWPYTVFVRLASCSIGRKRLAESIKALACVGWEDFDQSAQAHPVGPERPPVLVVALQPDHRDRVVLVVRDHDVVRPRPPDVVRLRGRPHYAAGRECRLRPASVHHQGTTLIREHGRRLSACSRAVVSTSAGIAWSHPAIAPCFEDAWSARAVPHPPPHCRYRGRRCPAPTPHHRRPASFRRH